MYILEFQFLIPKNRIKEILEEKGGGRMIFTALHEGFFTQIKVGFFAALCVTFPILIIQIWKFIAPALYKNEKSAFLPFLIATPVLFALGAAMVYYIVTPMAWNFFVGFEMAGSDLVPDGTYDITNFRMVHELSYDLDNGWDAIVSWSQQSQNYMNFRKNQSYRSVYLGLQGELYDTNTKEFAYYNPFSTSALTCSMRVCSEPLGEGTAATNPMAGDYPNQQWVADAIDLNDIWHYDTSYTQIDFLASGDVFELPAGTAALAFGMEYQ